MIKYDDINGLWDNSQRDWGRIENNELRKMLKDLAVSQSHDSAASTSTNTFYKKDDGPSNKLNPVRVWFTPGGYTTVEWGDGTKTTSHAENEETANQYCGFCACVVKKLYGNTTKAMKLMQDADEKAKEPAKKRKEERERHKKEKQYKVEHDRKLREESIQVHIRDIREKQEAERRVHEADERREFEQ